MSYINFYGAGATPPASGTADKWRIYITAIQSSIDWPNITEVEMRATSGGADQCVGGTASASSTNPSPPGGITRPASKAFDNDLGTMWQGSTATMPAWLEYDFPSPVSVTELSITTDNTSVGAVGSPKTFEIQHWNGTDWETDWSVADSGTWADGDVKVFTKP